MTHPPTQPVRAEFAALPAPALVSRYLRGVENFDRRVFELTEAQLDTAFMPEAGVGRWPARVLLGHLADAELVQAHRTRRALGEENPVFAVWDENAFIDAGLYGGPEAGPKHPIGGFIAVIHTLRKWTGEWLGTVEEKGWARAAMHPQRGPMTLRGIVETTAWHLEHHAWYLNRKVERFLGAGAER